MINNLSVWVAIAALIAASAVGGSAPEQPVLLYPQLAIGGGFQVVLILTNAGDTAFEGSLLLPDFGPGSGRIWLLDGLDQSGNDRATFSLAPLATKRFVLSAPEGEEATAGSLQVEADPGSSVEDLAAAFFYEFRVDGQLVDSIGVPNAAPAHHITVPVELSPGDRVNTGVAIRTRTDSSPIPAGAAATTTYRMALLGQDGDLLAETFTDFLGARFFDQLFPNQVPEGQPFTGALQIESETPLFLVALRQQLLGAGGFQITGIPARSPVEDLPAPSFMARYRVTFQADWSAQTHPVNFPPGPHFSGLIGGVHSDAAVFWQPGDSASTGIELMAEQGATSALANEIQFEIDRGNAGAVLRGGGIGRSPGLVTLEFEIDRRNSQVTLVSMVAPSPDWFVGVHNLNLFQAGDWVTDVSVDLFPYDAGTDDGEDYLSPNQDTQPPEPIRQINGAPFLNLNEVPPLGSFRFERIG